MATEPGGIQSRRSLCHRSKALEKVERDQFLQPRSGVRMQPTAQAVGKQAGIDSATEWRKKRYDTDSGGTAQLLLVLPPILLTQPARHIFAQLPVIAVDCSA